MRVVERLLKEITSLFHMTEFLLKSYLYAP